MNSRQLTARLNPMQQKFVLKMSEGLSPTAAAREAGYAQPGQAGFYNMRQPHIELAVRQARAARFSGELATIAANTLREVMTDTDAPASARVSAARLVLEVTREVGKGAQEADSGKELHEMTPDELAALIKKLDDQKRTIDAEPAEVGDIEDAEIIE
jgi:phage terminase small subunit